MNEQDAGRVLMEWIEGHPERQAAEQVFGLFQEAVASLVPDGATAGISDLAGTRSVIAVADGMFLTITIDLAAAGEEGDVPGRSPEVTCRVFPLDRRTATIEMHEHRVMRDGGPVVGVTEMRDRRWTLNLAEPVEISTREGLRAPFERDRGPSSAELVVRAVARDLGWNLPGDE